MLFNSYQFVCLFLPVVLAVCFVVSARFGATAAQDWLALASLFFYGVWNLQFLPLLLGSIVFNYLIARAMLAAPEDRRGPLMFAAIAVDLGLLGYYKYANYFVDTVDQVAGTGWTLGTILLPLGISFYTFQQITLLVDISQGRIERFRFRDFVLFVTFFPHLIAGPIVHHREMMPQFEKARYGYDPENLAVGFTLFAAGLFKKTVLADGMAGYVSPLFRAANAGQPLGLLDAWAASVGFALQMYFDFSGYSEMALGLARLFGIKLPMNFNSPLKATSVIDYWARWHITLTRFLTAYIYNPIAVSLTRRRMAAGRRGVAGAQTTAGAFGMVVALPTVTTMFLSGLWHGAGNQYLVFGLLHGSYLVICHGWRLYRPLFWPDAASYRRVMAPVGLVLTFCATAIALTYFKADSVAAGSTVVAGMFGLHGVTLPSTFAALLPGLAQALGRAGVVFVPASLPALLLTYAWIGVLLGIVLALPNVLQVMRDYQPALQLPAANPAQAWLPRLMERLRWQPTPRWAMLTAAAGMLGFLTLGEVTEFLYWQF